MKEDEYKFIEQKIKEGEIIPFCILKKYLNYKIDNGKVPKSKISFYRIKEDFSFHYLNIINEMNNYDLFLEKFNELKFCLSLNHLKDLSIKLKEEDFEEQKTIINNEPKIMFKKIYLDIKNLIYLKEDNSIREKITKFITEYIKIYSIINDIIFFPALLSNDNYFYNKLLYDFINCLNMFLKKRKMEFIENSEKDNKKKTDKKLDNNMQKIDNNLKKKSLLLNVKNLDKDKTQEGQKLLQKKRKRSDSPVKEEDKEHIEYENEEEFIASYRKLFYFMKSFEEVLDKIANDNNPRENFLRIKIMLYYLFCYEEKRKEYNATILNSIINTLLTSAIDDKILDKYEIYINNGKTKINKSNWSDIKDDQIVLIKIKGRFINTKIKLFNTKIYDLEDEELKYRLEIYDVNYLSIYGLRMQSFIFKNQEIEESLKNNLFNLLSSDIVKEGFQKFASRYNHDYFIYPFQGYYKKEIFDEIWNNIVVIPFIYQNICAKTERTDYTIFLDLYPYETTDSLESINIIFSKQNDLYHEIFQIISILYASNEINYEDDDYKSDSYISNEEKEKINKIIEKYSESYPKELQSKYELTDMGDIMEIFLFGIKPGQTLFYASIYLSNILQNNVINNKKIDDLRKKISNLVKLNDTIEKDVLNQYLSKKDNKEINELYEYFKNNNIWNICSKLYSSPSTISNIAYRRRVNNPNSVIYNFAYKHYREPCFPRRDKKIGNYYYKKK